MVDTLISAFLVVVVWCAASLAIALLVGGAVRLRDAGLLPVRRVVVVTRR